MPRSRVRPVFSVAIVSLVLAAGPLPAQSAPENKRCLTREQLNIEPIFSACPPLVDQASVSDNSFIARLRVYNGPSRYTMRWRGQGYFNEDVFTYNAATGLYDGFCATRACSIGHGGWVQMEHWDYFVGTLLADNVGTWTYEELHDDVVAQSRTFEVRELEPVRSERSEPDRYRRPEHAPSAGAEAGVVRGYRHRRRGHRLVDRRAQGRQEGGRLWHWQRQ